jgi:hypothetical protein
LVTRDGAAEGDEGDDKSASARGGGLSVAKFDAPARGPHSRRECSELSGGGERSNGGVRGIGVGEPSNARGPSSNGEGVETRHDWVVEIGGSNGGARTGGGQRSLNRGPPRGCGKGVRVGDSTATARNRKRVFQTVVVGTGNC